MSREKLLGTLLKLIIVLAFIDIALRIVLRILSK